MFSSREVDLGSKDDGADDEDMEVIDDLDEGSAEEDFSEGEDQLTESATPSSMSSKSESGLCPE